VKKFGGQQREQHTRGALLHLLPRHKENLGSGEKSFREKLSIHHLAC
jgi:hypothetical protein